MPIYEYQCSNCNYRFALLEPIGSPENGRECPKCGSRQSKRTISPFSTSAPAGEKPNNCKPSG